MYRKLIFDLQCVQDYIDVANVISKYAAAGIPLETMWTDIGATENSYDSFFFVDFYLFSIRLYAGTTHLYS